MSLVSTTAANISGAGTKQIAVPSGAAAGHIALLGITIDDTTSIIEDADFPTGFSPLQAQTNLTLDGQRIRFGWKRLTGADSGTYDFGTIAGTSGLILCGLWSGRHATDPPEISAASVSNAGNTNPVSVTANGVTALNGDDLSFWSAPDVHSTGIGAGHSQPTGYTTQQDTELAFSNFYLATKDNVGAGATGTVTSTFTITGDTSGWGAWLIRIPAAAAAVVIVGATKQSGPGTSPDYTKMFRARRLGITNANTGISGTLSSQLADTTLVATGTLAIAGTLAKTLDNTTLVATGTLPIVGTLSKTLADTTLVATGVLPIIGTLNKTLEDTTLVATGVGVTVISGVLDKTLDNTTLVATGTLALKGTLAVTLENTTLSAQGHGPIVDTEDTIDGESSYLINVAYGSVMLYHRGDRRLFTLNVH